MIPRDPRRRRRLVPIVSLLESRRLLSVTASSYGQIGVDLVGPDASQGGDGIQDMDVHLTGLAFTPIVDRILVTPTALQYPWLVQEGSVAWETQPYPGPGGPGNDGNIGEYGYSMAEFFQSPTDKTQGDLFINPYVRAVAAPAGTAFPGGGVSLGGSTGPLTTIQPNEQFTVWVYYQGSSTPDTGTYTVANLVSATDPMPTVPQPNSVTTNVMTVTDHGQDRTGNASEAGFDHLTVSFPSGFAFNTSDFTGTSGYDTTGGLVFTLSDPSGREWDSLQPEEGHNHLDTVQPPANSNSVDIYFPPTSTEAPVNGVAQKLTFQATIPGDSHIYTFQFAPNPSAGYDLTKLYNNLAGTTDTNVTSETQLDTDLQNGVGTIDLSTSVPGQVFTVNQPLFIQHSVVINGQNDTLVFNQNAAAGGTASGNTANWPWTASGAIYVNFSSGANHTLVTIENLTIEFASPPVWSNPPGDSPTTWDPENNPNNVTHAVIDVGNQASGLSTQQLTLTKDAIYSPPAYDSSDFSSLQQQGKSNGNTYVYVGEPAVPLLQSGGGGFGDYGTITGCTFQGGPISLSGGPWTITNNTVLGAPAYTYSPAAISVDGARDVLLEGNSVTQSAANGVECRLVDFSSNAGHSAYNNTVEDNSFSGGAGETDPNDATYGYNTTEGKMDFAALNDPEVMLAENNNVYFAGRLGAMSSDGQVIVLPDMREALNQTPTVNGYGDVVSILSGVKSDGSPDMTHAGQWFRVAQEVPISLPSNDLELLLTDAMPQPPSGGYFVVELTPGFVNDAYLSNTINLTDRTSCALPSGGNLFGNRIIGNQISYGSTYDGVFPQVAMAVTAGEGINPTSNPPNSMYGIPKNWTIMPSLGTVIEGNTFRDSLGLVVGVGHAISYYSGQGETALSAGRVYDTATIIGNTFSWDSSLLSSWASAFQNTFPAPTYNPPLSNLAAESQSPPTVTIGSLVAVDPAGQYGTPRYDWSVGGTDAQKNTPLFVDPVENQITVQGNVANTISNGTATLRSEPTGQVFEGTVNGSVVSSTIAPMQLDSGNWYYPFNVDDYPGSYAGNELYITGQPSGTQTPQALVVGQDNYDLTGPGTGAAAPDGVQDLHVQVTGLDAGASVASIEVKGTAPSGEDWKWPAATGYDQMAVSGLSSSGQVLAGSTTIDLFLGTSSSHLNDTFSLILTYATGGPITLPLQGVLFDPSLPVMPTVPQAPLSFTYTLNSSGQPVLAWGQTAGAVQYTVERTTNTSTWPTTALATVTTPTYTDTSVTPGTTYYYRVRAWNSAIAPSGASPYSQVISLTAGTRPDTLLATAAILYPTEGYGFAGGVATFTDSNLSATASQFTASINWGDGVTQTGTVTGSNGSFSISGSHTYSAWNAPGGFQVLVSVAKNGSTAAAATTSTAEVSQPYISVNLASYFTQVGITDQGSTVKPAFTAGGESYSSAYLHSTLSWGGLTFNLGAPNVNDEVPMGGGSITVAAGNYSALVFLGTTTGYNWSDGGKFRLDYTTGSSETYTLGLSDWKTGYSTPGTTAPGETIVSGSPAPGAWANCNLYTGGQDTPESPAQPVYLYGYTIPVDPTRQLADVALPNDGNMKLFAMDLVLPQRQVNLTSYYNAIGITAPGSTVQPTFDSAGESYSSSALGSSITWGALSFNIGPVGASDVVLAGGQPIFVPAGSYTGIAILGTTAGYGQTLGDPFRIDYADGTSETYVVGLSDWMKGYTGTLGQGTAPGEAVAKAMTSSNVFSGGVDSNTGGPVDLYGYVIPVDPSRQLRDLSLPNEPKIKILAMDLVTQPPQVNLGYALAPSNPPANEVGITTNATGVGSIDSAGDSYSATALGNSIAWNGQTFKFGAAAYNNTVSAAGSTITLPQGNYTSLEFLAADTSGNAEGVTFKVNYLGGSYDTFTQTFSDWMHGYTGANTTAPGESILPGSPMGTYHTSSGTATGKVYLYGYVFPVNPGLVVSSVTFPSGTYRVNILAINEVYQPAQVNLGHGTNQAGVPATEVGVTSSDNPGIGQFDAGGDSYVATASGQTNGLPNTISWNGQTFNMGAADVGTPG